MELEFDNGYATTVSSNIGIFNNIFNNIIELELYDDIYQQY